jgi:hypothetical protein
LIIDLRFDNCPACGAPPGSDQVCRCCDLSKARERSASTMRRRRVVRPFAQPGPELSTRLFGIDDSVGHDEMTGEHEHAHLAHSGPDHDGDGIHAHVHSHDHNASHDHSHVGVAEEPDLDDLLQDAKEMAAVPTESSSSGRGPRGSPGVDRELQMLGLPSDADSGTRYARAVELRDQCSLDWERAVRAMHVLRDRTGGFDFASARHLDPVQRHNYVAALETEAAAADCERRYWVAQRLVEHLDAREAQLMQPGMGLLHRPDYEPPIMIHGSRSLGLSDGGPSEPEATREFISPVGITGGRRAEPVDPGQVGLGDGKAPPPRERL